MRLTILGSGTAAPLLERNNSGYLLEADNKKILLDTGAGTIRRLLEIKRDLGEINHIFYTHLHNDHINDLGAIIWANRYGLKRKKQLNLYGPAGLKSYYLILSTQLLKLSKWPFDVKIKELGNSALKINQLKIKTQKIIHSPASNSVAYRIEHKNKVFVYTGDTEFCKETIKIAQGADFLMTECSHPDKMKMHGHLTPAYAGKLAREANAKNLILTHFYPEVLKIGIKKFCSKEFSGKIILARDKMRINI